MTSVAFEGNQCGVADGESVLDSLIRNGHDIPSGCRAGVCQACIMVVDAGDIPAPAQKGLSAAQIALNQFLSCQCKPAQPVAVRRASMAATRVEGTVVEKCWLNEQVLRLRLEATLDYIPGQYVTLWKDSRVARSYSLASHPDQDDFLEVHIKHIPGGKFSSWASGELGVGDSLGIQGPLGQCIYTATAGQPLLLAAIGTGLAPIYGILRDALAKGHSGPIDLVAGASSTAGFYLVDELQQLAEAHPGLNVHFVAQQADPGFAVEADIYQYCKQAWPDMKGVRVLLCGADSFVRKMRKQCFLGGASMADISADVFLPFGT